MSNLWITYAWADNEDKDIDFIVQELDKTDLTVKFDRRNLIPGQRLWTQIGGSITDPELCDAWAIVLTRNSLGSHACIEELSYALDRALSSHDESFPMFALLHKVDASAMPPALKIRLSISLESSNWKDQVVAATKKRPVGFSPQGLVPFHIIEHILPEGLALEVHPRFDRISPFYFVVDLDEHLSGNVGGFMVGPSGRLPQGGVMTMVTNSESKLHDGTPVWVQGAQNEATSTTSYFLYYKSRPKRIWIGNDKGLEILAL